MLSKFWCPVDLIGRINSAEDGFGRARFFGDLSRQPSEMGRWKTFSREPAEFLAGKGEERRGEERRGPSIRFKLHRQRAFVTTVPTYYLEAMTKAQPRGPISCVAFQCTSVKSGNGGG